MRDPAAEMLPAHRPGEEAESRVRVAVFLEDGGDDGGGDEMDEAVERGFYGGGGFEDGSDICDHVGFADWGWGERGGEGGGY